MESNKKRKFNAIMTLVLGIISVYVSYRFNSGKDEKLTQKQLTNVKDVVTLIKDEIPLRKKNYPNVKINLKNYPDIDFKTRNETFMTTNKNLFFEEVKVGDTLTIDIKKEDYLTKISKNRKVDFSEENNVNSIWLVTLKDKKYNYLSLSQYNDEDQSNAVWGTWIFGIFGLLLIVAGIISLKTTEETV